MIAAAMGGMQMKQSELLLLARTLAEARGVTLNTVSKWTTRDTNPMLFDRLAAGRSCSPRTWIASERGFAVLAAACGLARGRAAPGAHRRAEGLAGATIAPSAFPALYGLPARPRCELWGESVAG